MSTRMNVAVRHYYIGLVTGVGIVLSDTKPAVGFAMAAVGIVAQTVLQWRAGNADLRAKGRAS